MNIDDLDQDKVRADLRQRFDEAVIQELKDENVPEDRWPRMIELMNAMLEVSLAQIRGCTCSELPADPIAAAKQEHHPECPLAAT